MPGMRSRCSSIRRRGSAAGDVHRCRWSPWRCKSPHIRHSHRLRPQGIRSSATRNRHSCRCAAAGPKRIHEYSGCRPRDNHRRCIFGPSHTRTPSKRHRGYKADLCYLSGIRSGRRRRLRPILSKRPWCRCGPSCIEKWPIAPPRCRSAPARPIGRLPFPVDTSQQANRRCWRGFRNPTEWQCQTVSRIVQQIPSQDVPWSTHGQGTRGRFD